MRENESIRAYARSKGVFQYEIARMLGVSEMTLTRRMRNPLDEDESAKLRAVIDRIAEEKEV